MFKSIKLIWKIIFSMHGAVFINGKPTGVNYNWFGIRHHNLFIYFFAFKTEKVS